MFIMSIYSKLLLYVWIKQNCFILKLYHIVAKLLCECKIYPQKTDTSLILIKVNILTNPLHIIHSYESKRYYDNDG